MQIMHNWAYQVRKLQGWLKLLSTFLLLSLIFVIIAL
jgi:hypothetical protein